MDQTAGAVERAGLMAAMVRDNVPVKLIAARLGMHDKVVQRRVSSFVREHGIDYQLPTRGVFVSEFEAGPVKTATQRMRANLGGWLCAYQESFNPPLSPAQASRATGLTLRAVHRASQRPFHHNWTIVEMARLAALLNMSLNQLAQDVATRRVDMPPRPQPGVFVLEGGA